MRKNPQQEITVEFRERQPDDLPEIEEFSGIRAGLNHAMVGLADHQQRAMRLDGAREMDLFPFAVRKIGFSERWGSVGMQRQINPLEFPRVPSPCRRGRND
jgi:hypothetical protein